MSMDMTRLCLIDKVPQMECPLCDVRFVKIAQIYESQDILSFNYYCGKCDTLAELKFSLDESRLRKWQAKIRDKKRKEKN